MTFLQRHTWARLLVEVVVIGGLLVGAQLSLRSLPLGLPYLAAGVIVACGYVALIRIVERRSVTELALRGAAGDVAAGLVIGVSLFGAVIGVIALLGGYSVTGTRGARALLGALPLAIGAGIAEEIAFRGVVFRVVEEWLGTAAALAISALLFGLLHLGNPHATWWSSLAIAIEAGVLLAVAFTVTRRLWLPIGIHAAWNWTQASVFGAAVSGTSSVGWLRGELHGPEILTGGNFGPEASLPAVVICLAVAVVLFRRRRPLSRTA